MDNDPQFNATTALIKPQRYIDSCIKGNDQLTIYNLYEKPPRLRGRKRKEPDPKKFFMQAWYMTSDPKISLDVIPSRIELYETLRNPSQKEYLLENFLKKNASQYDYIFIDCHQLLAF